MIRNIALVLMALSTTLPHAASTSIRLNVPFVSQEENRCGAACILMVMQYWKQQGYGEFHIEEAQIRASLVQGNHGVFASEMGKFLTVQGFRVFPFHGQWADLEHHLHRGRPLIVAIDGGSRKLHYVVVSGIDAEESVVQIHDPARRKLWKLKGDEFIRRWEKSGNWTLLAVPK